MVSVQCLYFLAGCEPLEKRLKADAVPSVFALISGTSLVQLARQCRRAQTVALNNVSRQTPHTTVDVGQIYRLIVKFVNHRDVDTTTETILIQSRQKLALIAVYKLITST